MGSHFNHDPTSETALKSLEEFCEVFDWYYRVNTRYDSFDLQKVYKLKAYRSNEISLATAHLKPVLSTSNIISRAVAYFSSSVVLLFDTVVVLGWVIY